MTSPQPQPTQAGAPSGAPQPSNPGQQQASGAQEFFAKRIMEARQLGANMTIIQPEMQQISALWVQALQKVSQAASGPAQPMQAAPQQ